MSYVRNLHQINGIIVCYRKYVDVKAREKKAAAERVEPERLAFVEAVADLIDAGGRKNDVARAIGNTNWTHITALWVEGGEMLDRRHGAG